MLNKFYLGSVYCFLYIAFGWIILFLWAKAESYAEYSWWVAFSPIWIVYIGFYLFVLTIAILACVTGDRSLFLESIIVFLLTSCSMAFLLMLSWNLERQERDEPMLLWVIVYIPLFIFEGTLFVAVTAVVIHYKNRW